MKETKTKREKRKEKREKEKRKTDSALGGWWMYPCASRIQQTNSTQKDAPCSGSFRTLLYKPARLPVSFMTFRINQQMMMKVELVEEEKEKEEKGGGGREVLNY